MELIFIASEPIYLAQILKIIGYIESGGAAKFFLYENECLVNEVRTTARKKKIYGNDIITINNQKFKVVLHG